MACGACGLQWDLDDPDPPLCGLTAADVVDADHHPAMAQPAPRAFKPYRNRR
jgi:hypothetical protein